MQKKPYTFTVFSAMVCMVTSGGSVNLLKNGDFSKQMSDWKTYTGHNADLTYKVVDKGGADAFAELEIEYRSEKKPHRFFTMWQNVKVKPSTRYRLSVKVAVERAARAFFWFGGGTPKKSFGSRKYAHPGSYDWKELSQVYKTGPKQTDFLFRICIGSKVGKLRIDDVAMVELGMNITKDVVSLKQGFPVVPSTMNGVDNKYNSILEQVKNSKSSTGVVFKDEYELYLPFKRSYIAAFYNKRGAGTIPVNLTLPEGSNSFALAPQSVAVVSFNIDNRESASLETTINGKKEIFKISAVPTPDKANLNAALNKIKSRYAGLLRLINQYKVKNAYLDVYLACQKRYLQYIPEEIANKNFDRAEFYCKVLKEQLGQVERVVRGLSSGRLAIRNVNMYRTGSIKIKDYAFTADTGAGRAPMFFYGYGHFSQARNNIPTFNQWGVNIIQTGLGPRVTCKADGSFKSRWIDNIIVPALKNGEKYNVAMTYLPGPHQLPDWFWKKHPDLKRPARFMPYDIQSPVVWEILKKHYVNTAKILVKYKSLQSFTLTNEPTFPGVHRSKVENDRYRKYLKQVYSGSIRNLNKVYNSNYKSFAEVELPQVKDKPANARFYDFVRYNMNRMTEFHRKLGDWIHEGAPAIPVHSKINNHIFDRFRILDGIDPEDICLISDINGCDSAWDPRGSRDFVYENMFYDLLRSMKKAPIFDSEGHFWNDKDLSFGPGMGDHTRTVLWEGALHGRSAITIWLWRRALKSSIASQTSMINHPECLVPAGATGLDLVRLAKELVMFQNKPAEVALLYSVPAIVWDMKYCSTVSALYRQLANLGIKVDFISARLIAQGKLNNYKYLILPSCSNVHKDAFDGIVRYVKASGKLYFAGALPVANEHGTSFSKSAVNVLKKKGVSLAMVNRPDELRRRLSALIPRDISVRNFVDGKDSGSVVWHTVKKTDGSSLISLINLNDSAVTVSIYGGSKRIGKFKNMFTGQTFKANSLLLPVKHPVLLEF